jgi:hypothetical protein
MENINQTLAREDTNTSAPVHTGAHTFESWMTVQEAVAYCLSKGLPRTPKTIRKWAQRSMEGAPGSGDVIVQRQDTENGFRWLISRDSLDVKIDQEKELALRSESERPDVNPSEPVGTGSHPFEQVATGVHPFEQVFINGQAVGPMPTHVNPSEPVPTGSHHQNIELTDFLKKQLERAEHQLDVKDRQIEALLERDRETNILIQGLQSSLTGVVNALPSSRRNDPHPTQHYEPTPSHQTEEIRDA